MEAFLKIAGHLNKDEKEIVGNFARLQLNAPKKASVKTATKLLSIIRN